MSWKTSRIGLGLAIVMAVAVVLATSRLVRRSPELRPLQSNRGTMAGVDGVASTGAVAETSPPNPRDPWAVVLTRLRQADGREAALAAIAALEGALVEQSWEEGSAFIRSFLDSGRDAPMPLEFAVGTDGFLTGAPTLRVWLLDYLAKIDPRAAAAYAKEVLSRMDSADEWSVALRNFALGMDAPGGRQFLAAKVEAMLRHAPWRENPSRGYLEAFDAAVHLGQTNLVPTLAELLRWHDNPAVAHAAYLALDRMILGNPVDMLALFHADLQLMQGREATRANYFARADVRDPRQRGLLEAYLLDPGLAAAELDRFASVYPNANFMISRNLLTTARTPTHAELVSRDTESLRVIGEWLADPRFDRVRPPLEQARRRLEGFVEAARRE